MIANVMPNPPVTRDPKPLDYRPERFFHRREELNRLAEWIQHSKDSVGVLFDYWGIEGIGKTWLLREIQNRYSFSKDSQFNTFALYYEFRDGSPRRNFVRELAEQTLFQNLELGEQETSALEQLAQNGHSLDSLVKVLFGISKRVTPILLLDNVEEVTDKEWESIEKKLIEPLVSSTRVAFVIAGRFQIPRWREFEVRRRLRDLDKTRLKPWSEEEIETIIEQRGYNFLPEVGLNYLGGSPGLLDRYGSKLTRLHITSKSLVLDPSRKSALLDILQQSEISLLEHVNDNLRKVILEIFPLRFYRTEALRKMVPSQRASSEDDYLKLVRNLAQNTELVWWDRDQRAYVTSEVVRRVINNHAFEREPAEFQKKHQVAYEMYGDWVNNSPATSENFIIEMWYHLGNMNLVRSNTKQLLTDAGAILTRVETELKPDRLLVLEEQLKEGRDPELHELLSEEIRKALSEQVDDIRKRLMS